MNWDDDLSVEDRMNMFLVVSDAVAEAMSKYASSVTGSKWRKTSFMSEADFIVGEVIRAGYQITPRINQKENQNAT
jgi:hypothetical protein